MVNVLVLLVPFGTAPVSSPSSSSGSSSPRGTGRSKDELPIVSNPITLERMVSATTSKSPGMIAGLALLAAVGVAIASVIVARRKRQIESSNDSLAS